MSKQYHRSMLKIAADIALLGDPERQHRLGAIAKRKDGALVFSYNGRPFEKNAPSHAEFRLSKKLDSANTVYVARLGRTSNEMRIAKPCRGCEIALQSRKVEKVIYSISDNEYGVLFL